MSVIDIPAWRRAATCWRFASAMVTAASAGEKEHIPVPARPPTSSGSDPPPLRSAERSQVVGETALHGVTAHPVPLILKVREIIFFAQGNLGGQKGLVPLEIPHNMFRPRK
jgi:hypothetical protein